MSQMMHVDECEYCIDSESATGLYSTRRTQGPYRGCGYRSGCESAGSGWQMSLGPRPSPLISSHPRVGPRHRGVSAMQPCRGAPQCHPARGSGRLGGDLAELRKQSWPPVKRINSFFRRINLLISHGDTPHAQTAAYQAPAAGPSSPAMHLPHSSPRCCT